jgi:translation initiation factor 3 subunit E
MADGATNGATNGTDAHSSEDVATQYDLLPKLVKHLDRHMVFPILQFVGENGDEEEEISITKAKYELLRHTNMADFVGDLYVQIHNLDEKPAEYANKRDAVLKQREQYQEQTEKIVSLLEDQDVVGNLRSDKVANLNYLKEQHGVTIEMVNSLYEMGQFQYSMGDYGGAADSLYQFRVLV